MQCIRNFIGKEGIFIGKIYWDGVSTKGFLNKFIILYSEIRGII